MMHDARLPPKEQIMNGNNPFETVSTPLGTMERWRAEAMLIGTTGGIQSFLQTVRNDAAELEKKTVELDANNSGSRVRNCMARALVPKPHRSSASDAPITAFEAPTPASFDFMTATPLNALPQPPLA
jgi:hypothetical protein